MPNTSPAEIMLDSLVAAQRLIRRLQDVLKAPARYVGIDPSPATKATTAAFHVDLQAYIDELTAQREKTVALVKLIPDQTARTVIELRYGLIGSGCDLMPYPDIGETLNYADKTILSYRKKGADQLNQILKSTKDDEGYAET